MRLLQKIILLMLLACCPYLQAAPPGSAYHKLLDRTATVTGDSSLCALPYRHTADSLKQLTATEVNFAAASRLVLDVCSALYDKDMFHETIVYVSGCLPILEASLPTTGEAQTIYVNLLDYYGIAYGSLGLSQQSLFIFRRALGIAEKWEMEKEMAVIYNNMGSIYMATADYAKADSLFLEAVRINERLQSTDRLFINYNNLSVSAAQSSRYNKALEYGFLAMHQLESSADTAQRMLLQRNIAGIYLKNNEPAPALRNLREVMLYYERHGLTGQLADTYRTAAYAFDENSDSFAIYLNKAESAARASGTIREKAGILQEAGNLRLRKNNYKEACEYFKEYAALQDSSSTAELRNLEQSLVGLYAEEDRLSRRFEEAELQRQKADNRALTAILAGIVGLILAVTVAAWLCRRREKALFRKARNRLREKIKHIGQLENRLDSSRQLLKTKDDNLDLNEKKRTVLALQAVRFNEFLDTLSVDIRHLLLQLSVRDTDTRKSLKSVISDIDRMENDSALKEFVGTFENINRTFYTALQSDYPNLTARELRMCALIRLGLSNKEIADITFREVRSVEAVRNRLRKKFSLPADETLSDFLKRF